VESGIVMEERLEEFIRKLKNRHYNISFYEKHITAENTVRERDIERFIQYLKKNLKFSRFRELN
jgi:hypothetical protein